MRFPLALILALPSYGQILAPILFQSPAAAAGGFAIVGHCSQASNGSSTTSTCTIADTTGADSCYVATSQFNDNAQVTTSASDNKGNTYTLVPDGIGVVGANSMALFYSKGLTVGASHSFTITTTGSSTQDPVAVVCVSGSLTTGGADQENAFNNSGGSVTTVQAGSVTPSNSGQFIAAVLATSGPGAMSIDSGFTILESVAPSGGTTQGIDFAYLIQTAAAAVNPTWTLTGTATTYIVTAQNATFKSH
jgi:hypothetical protein